MGSIAAINPRAFDLTPHDDDLVSFVPMAAIEEESGTLDGRAVRYWRDVRKGYTRFQEGDIVLAKITPCMENGKFAVARNLHGGRAAGTTELHVLRASNIVESRYLLHFLLQEDVRSAARRAMRGAAGQLRVPPEFVAHLEIPLPPLAEQQRIVSAIEEHLTKLDAAVAALERARANVRNYRDAYAHAALAGMTDSMESTAHGTNGNHQVNRAQWVQEEWGTATLDDLAERITSGSRDWSPYYGKGVCVFVLAQNVRRGRLDLSAKQLVGPPALHRDRERSRIAKDDLLVTIVGANTGDACRVDRELNDHYVCQSVALIRLRDKSLASFVELYLNSEGDGRAELLRRAYGQGRPHLNFDQLKTLSIPIPPRRVRDAVVAGAQRVFSVLDRLDSQIDAEVKRASRLRQAILKRAFEGKLVPQNPDDEPASASPGRAHDGPLEPPAKKARARRGKPSPSNSATQTSFDLRP